MKMKTASPDMKMKSPKACRRSGEKWPSCAVQSSEPDAGSVKKSPDAKSNAPTVPLPQKKSNNSLKNFYIFRHGECPLNVSGHIQGQSIDGELTEKGRRQIHVTGQILRDKKIEVIISSPLKRAQQSAQIVSFYVKCPILLDERLKEVNMGVVEGMHVSEVAEKYRDLYAQWQNCGLNDKTTRFENGETKAEVRKRIFTALSEYAENTPYKNIAISAHGITISQALLVFNIKKSNIPNGSILHLSYHNRHWKYLGFIEAVFAKEQHPSSYRLIHKSETPVFPFNSGESNA